MLTIFVFYSILLSKADKNKQKIGNVSDQNKRKEPLQTTLANMASETIYVTIYDSVYNFS